MLIDVLLLTVTELRVLINLIQVISGLLLELSSYLFMISYCKSVLLTVVQNLANKLVLLMETCGGQMG